MRTLPLLENRKSGGNKVKDFLGEGDYQPTGQGEETLRTLGGIMALEGQTDLHDAPAQQDQSNGPDQGKDKGREVVDYIQRISGGKNSRVSEAQAAYSRHISCKSFSSG